MIIFRTPPICSAAWCLPVRFSRLFVDGAPADEVLLTAGNRVRPLAIRGVGRDQTDVIATAYSGGSGTRNPAEVERRFRRAAPVNSRRTSAGRPRSPALDSWRHDPPDPG